MLTRALTEQNLPSMLGSVRYSMDLKTDAQKNFGEKSGCTGIECDAKQEIERVPTQSDSKEGGQETMGGSVYFVRSPDGTFVKIGFTTLSVAIRFDQIANGLPGLRLLGYLPGTRHTETWLHSKFGAFQESGEWFRAAHFLDKTLTPERRREIAVQAAKKRWEPANA